MYIDKGTHFGTPVAFCVEVKNDGSFWGDIRVGGDALAKAGNFQMYSPMDGSAKHASTEAAVVAALEADLAAMIADAEKG